MRSIFVPCKLVNPLNGAHGHWAAKAATRKRLRANACVIARTALAPRLGGAPAVVPKTIRFTARTWNQWDDDAIPAACKPLRDGLVDAGVIHSDAPSSGHVFLYGQVVDRARRGVEITVEAIG